MKKIWMMAACAATFYACSSSDINTPEIQETGTLQVSTSVLTQNTKGTKKTPSTKADTFHSGPVMGTALAQGSQIGVFVFNKSEEATKIAYSGSKNESNDGFNKSWVNNNGWTGDEFILGIQPADVFAYFPYIHSISPLSDNTIQPAYDAIPVAPGYTDYLYGKSSKTVNSTSSNATIQLNHALAMISFTFKRGTGYPSDEACQVNAITIKNLPAEGVMSVVDGFVSNSTLSESTINLKVSSFNGSSYKPEIGADTWGEWTDTICNFKNNPIGAVAVSGIGNVVQAPLFHALVMPNTEMLDKDNIADSSLHAVIKIDGVSYKIALNVINTIGGGNANSWESNKHYTYNLTIKGTSGQGNALEVSSVTVRQWEQGGSSDIEI